MLTLKMVHKDLLLFFFLVFSIYTRVVFAQSSSGLTVLINPESRLISVGTIATFTCKFGHENTESTELYWKIGETEANNMANRIHLETRGFFIADNDVSNGNTVTTMTMTVNGSYNGINNTRIQCKSLDGVHSQPATLLTIAESPIHTNPLLEHPNATSILFKWSPPYLWPGYYIATYNISVKNHSDESITYYQVNSSSFRDAVLSFTYNQTNFENCALFTFGVTPLRSELSTQTHSVQGGYWSTPGGFSVSPIVLFMADGTPVVRARILPSPMICSYQEVNYTLVIQDSGRTFTVSDGPIPHSGAEEIEREITSHHFRLKQDYHMTVTADTVFERATALYGFNTSIELELESIIEPCTTVYTTNEPDTGDSVFKYKVAMAVCVSLAILMLFTLISALVCLIIRCQKKRSREKTFSESTSRVQNAMVHNPIYDGPVYDSILGESHFDSLASVTKQDLSLSNASQSESPCNSPPPSQCGADTGRAAPHSYLQDNSPKTVRYLDRPIHPRSQSLTPLSNPNNSTPRSTSVCVVPTGENTRMMALKKNGKERNKLHLTLTLNNENDEKPAPPRHVRGKDVTSPALRTKSVPGSGPAMRVNNDVIATTATSSEMDADENYTVMSPVGIRSGGRGSLSTKVIELSPEDTAKYRESASEVPRTEK